MPETTAWDIVSPVFMVTEIKLSFDEMDELYTISVK